MTRSRIALVTGGTAGIGLATAQALFADGARVYVTGRSEERLREAADAGLIPIRADMADLDDIRAVAARIGDDGAVLDVLVANAGTAETTVFGEIEPEAFDRTFDLNVRGVFFTVQSLLPHLSDGASVALIGSIVSIKGMADLSVYNASKAAVRSFARSWANDLKARRIRVNTVSPGPVRTPLAHQLQGEADGSIAAFEEWTAQNAPAGRIGEPDDIASAVCFLAGCRSPSTTLRGPD